MKRRAAFVATCILIIGCRTDAQVIPKSQAASVGQTIGSARIEIVYRRPVARGRELFGALVPYDRVWSPSADTAAIFSTTRPLDVESSHLNAGRYSVWAIPGKDTWTVIFSSAVPVFHLRYREASDVIRVKVAPQSGDHMETLGFYFPMVDADSAVLALHWGKTVVPLKIRAR
ncbi:MAG TPA: DUF2911 domain-containing protein [Gemmatimonadaceae bacterium]|nr:DUF2911 domain-containing protein [Gemmatimonadaceae bacterium]